MAEVRLIKAGRGPGGIFPVLVIPGTVAAGTAITLPNYAKGVKEILQALLFLGSDGVAAAVAKNLTVVTGAPAAGQIQLVDENTIKLGDATTTRDFLLFIGRYESITVPLG